VEFRGESLRRLAADWLQTDRTPGGLLQLTRAEGFYPKLAIYLVHYGGIALGLTALFLPGMWRRWRSSLPVMGFILYITLLHLVLLALPRYIFPTLPFWWSLGAVVLVRLWDVRLRVFGGGI
jgi:hypothetical protein